MTANKYPNADTSPERLAEIEEEYCREGYAMSHTPLAIKLFLRDLLAMLQERTVEKDAYVDNLTAGRLECNELRQQLHDQRWRRVSEERVPYNIPVEIWFHEIPHSPEGDGMEFVSGHLNMKNGNFYATNSDTPIALESKDWWRPIPPLLKE